MQIYKFNVKADVFFTCENTRPCLRYKWRKLPSCTCATRSSCCLANSLQPSDTGAQKLFISSHSMLSRKSPSVWLQIET